jgi:ribosomal protein S18 acetylase RimI-like enzyme
MVRQTMPEDIPEIQALMKSIPGFWQSHWSRDTVAHALDTANGLSFVWEEDSQILGFVCAHDLGFRACLSELAVSPPCQHRGIGRALLEKVEHRLSARQRTILIADVWRDAVPFYRALGWESPEAVLLRKKLPPSGPDVPE